MTDNNLTPIFDNNDVNDDAIPLINIELREVEEVVQKQPFIEGLPEGVPVEFWDYKTKSVKTKELAAAYTLEQKQRKDLRRIISKGIKKPAESTADYDFTPDEEVQQYFSRPEDAAIIEAARIAALESGMAKDQLGVFMNRFYKTQIEQGVLTTDRGAARSEAQEVETRREEARKRYDLEMSTLDDVGQKNKEKLEKFATRFYDSGRWSDNDIKQVRKIASTADGINFLSRIVNTTYNNEHIPTKVAITNNDLTIEEINGRMRDPRNQSDPSFRLQTKAAWERIQERKQK